MPGAGKSTVGVVAAKALRLSFLDTDLILQDAGGAVLSELLASWGSEKFVSFEADQISALKVTNTVIATGGSAVLTSSAMGSLQSQGRLVWLDVPFDTIAARLGAWDGRGVVCRPGQSLRELYDERVPLYRSWADVVVEVERDEPLVTTARRLVQRVREGL